MSSGSISVTHWVQNTIFHHWKWHDGNRLRSLTRSHFHLSGTGMSLKSDTEFPRAAADLWPAVRSFFNRPTSDRRSGLMYWSSDGVGWNLEGRCWQEAGLYLYNWFVLVFGCIVFLINKSCVIREVCLLVCLHQSHFRDGRHSPAEEIYSKWTVHHSWWSTSVLRFAHWASGPWFSRLDVVGTETNEMDSCQGVLWFCGVLEPRSRGGESV